MQFQVGDDTGQSVTRVELLAAFKLAAQYSSGKRNAEAEALLRATLARTETTVGPEHPWTAETLTCLSEICAEQQKYQEAIRLRRRALEIDKQALGSDAAQVAASHMSLGGLYLKLNCHDDAEDAFKRALAIRRRICREGDTDLRNSMLVLGLFYRERGRHSEAEPLLREANWQGYGVVELSDELESLVEAVESQMRDGDLDEAEECLTRAFQHGRRLKGDHPGLAAYFVRLARLKSQLGERRGRR